MRLLAINGKMGSGKDTVCRILQVLTSDVFYNDLDQVLNGSREKEDILNMDWDKFMDFNKDMPESQFYQKFNSFENKKFATALRGCISALTGVSVTALEDRDTKDTEDLYLNMTYRRAHQVIADALRDGVYEDIFVDALFRNFNEDSKWIITDLRQVNEYSACLDYFPLFILVKGEEPTEDTEENTHKSENELLESIGEANFDFTIDNTDKSKGFKPLVSQVYDFLTDFELFPWQEQHV